jgi:hypothetical protein
MKYGARRRERIGESDYFAFIPNVLAVSTV